MFVLSLADGIEKERDEKFEQEQVWRKRKGLDRQHKPSLTDGQRMFDRILAYLKVGFSYSLSSD